MPGYLNKKTKKELLDILEELWMGMEEPDQLDLLQRYSSDYSDAASTFLATRAQKSISRHIFYIVACQVEKKHIAKKVHEVTMLKLISDQCK